MCLVAQTCLTLRDSMDYSLPGSPWGFSRQEYWSGLPWLPPGDLSNPGIEPRPPTLQADSLPSEPPVGGSLNPPSALISRAPFLAMEDVAQGRLWQSAQPGPLPHRISLKLPLNFVPGPGVWDGTVLWISCRPGRIATGPWHIYSLPNWDTWQPALPPPAGMPGIVLDCSCLFTAGNIFPGSLTMSKFLTSSLAGSNQA